MSRRGSLATSGALAAVAIVLGGCGRTPDAGGGAHQAAAAAAESAAAESAARTLPLATSGVDASGTGWAVVQLGGPSAREDNFWQVFVRPADAAAWHLVTPAGVADNGGLVLTSTGAGSLITGFRPSQDLTFSPLAVTTDAGTRWSPGPLVSPGLRDVPDALAAGPDGRLIALTDGGGVELGTGRGARWTRLTSAGQLAARPAGRACGLAGLTAAAFTVTGTPVLGGTCRRPGTAGIFVLHNGAWRAAGPVLAAGRANGGTQVLGLGTGAGRIMALLAVGHGARASVVAAWSADGGARWTLSPALATGPRLRRSASLWPGGAAGLVLSGGRGETIAGPGAEWTVLPALPAGTATLARGPAGATEALTTARGSLAVWHLRAGAAGWSRSQLVRVPVPYGSSG